MLGHMIEYLTAHTADVPAEVLTASRDLLGRVFEGEFEDEDWTHSLGGVHVVARVDGTVVGHASVIQRRLMTGGRPLRAGYVEGVGVDADWRRRGVAGEMMGRLERVIRVAYDIGGLGATDEAMALYLGRGWQVWRGPLAALTPSGMVATPDEAGAVLVLPVGPLDLDAELACDWRDGDVW
jgi:aminoglycoside 2'-N-acetyltransferase I